VEGKESSERVIGGRRYRHIAMAGTPTTHHQRQGEAATNQTGERADPGKERRRNVTSLLPTVVGHPCKTNLSRSRLQCFRFTQQRRQRRQRGMLRRRLRMSRIHMDAKRQRQRSAFCAAPAKRHRGPRSGGKYALFLCQRQRIAPAADSGKDQSRVGTKRGRGVNGRRQW